MSSSCGKMDAAGRPGSSCGLLSLGFRLAFAAFALAALVGAGLLELIDLHGQRTQDILIDLQLPLEFLHGLRRRIDVEKNVMAFAVLLDAVGERTQAPIFLLLDLAAFAFDNR